MITTDEEFNEVQAIASDYVRRGYAVTLMPEASQLPEALRPIAPDIIAENGDERVLIEFMGTRGPSDAGNLEHKFDVARKNGWSFVVRFAGVPVEGEQESVTLEPMLATQMTKLADEIDALQKSDHRASAFLMAWALLEATVRHAAQQIGATLDLRRPQDLAVAAEHLNLLLPEQRNELMQGRQMRNHITHGGKWPDNSEMDRFIDLVRLAVRRAQETSR